MMKSEKYQHGKVMIIQQRVLLDYAYFKDNYKLTAVDLSKYLLIQQIVFQGVVGGENNTKIRLYTILEKSKETILEFYNGTIKI